MGRPFISTFESLACVILRPPATFLSHACSRSLAALRIISRRACRSSGVIPLDALELEREKKLLPKLLLLLFVVALDAFALGLLVSEVGLLFDVAAVTCFLCPFSLRRNLSMCKYTYT